MTISLSPVQNSKIGTCPHGLPPGACPICSGAGGGGGGAAKKADFSAKAGEMSWADCAAMGQIIKNQKMAQNQGEQSLQSQMIAAMNFQKNISNLALRMSNFVQNIQNSAIPAIISKPLSLIAEKMLIPMLNVLKDIPLNFQKALINIAEKVVDISDKLTAMFGELKNSIEKKISDKLKDFKKKIKSFFGLFEDNEFEEEVLYKCSLVEDRSTRHAELVSASCQYSHLERSRNEFGMTRLGKFFNNKKGRHK